MSSWHPRAKHRRTSSPCRYRRGRHECHWSAHRGGRHRPNRRPWVLPGVPEDGLSMDGGPVANPQLVTSAPQRTRGGRMEEFLRALPRGDGAGVAVALVDDGVSVPAVGHHLGRLDLHEHISGDPGPSLGHGSLMAAALLHLAPSCHIRSFQHQRDPWAALKECSESGADLAVCAWARPGEPRAWHGPPIVTVRRGPAELPSCLPGVHAVPATLAPEVRIHLPSGPRYGASFLVAAVAAGAARILSATPGCSVAYAVRQSLHLALSSFDYLAPEEP